MNFKQFHKQAKEWGVSNYFIEQMRIAMIGSGDKKAKLNPEYITKQDAQFMVEFGYELDMENMEVEV